jgi:hypothetical protein
MYINRTTRRASTRLNALTDTLHPAVETSAPSNMRRAKSYQLFRRFAGPNPLRRRLEPARTPGQVYAWSLTLSLHAVNWRMEVRLSSLTIAEQARQLDAASRRGDLERRTYDRP